VYIREGQLAPGPHILLVEPLVGNQNDDQTNIGCGNQVPLPDAVFFEIQDPVVFLVVHSPLPNLPITGGLTQFRGELTIPHQLDTFVADRLVLILDGITVWSRPICDDGTQVSTHCVLVTADARTVVPFDFEVNVEDTHFHAKLFAAVVDPLQLKIIGSSAEYQVGIFSQGSAGRQGAVIIVPEVNLQSRPAVPRCLAALESKERELASGMGCSTGVCQPDSLAWVCGFAEHEWGMHSQNGEDGLLQASTLTV
jgi:hypothetical protein